MLSLKELFKGATNIYRTKFFIVKQQIGIQYCNIQNNVVFSHDTYIRRTKTRDKEYKNYFKNKSNIDGKRLPTTMFARIYID